MKEVFKWKTRGKGAFAFLDGAKVLQGSTCALLRNQLNTIGEINGLLKIAPSTIYAS
jgi:hypothetical protein